MKLTLTNNNYTVTLNTLGAELNSYRSPKGQEFIWNSDPEFWLRSSPLLFPTIGNVRNGSTIFEGREYQLPKHGFCKESEFICEAQTANEVTFLLTDSAATLEHYPYHFELRLNYRLESNHLFLTYQVTNRDDRTMYYHIGAHPGFMCPIEEGEAFEDYVISFEKEERLESIVYDLSTLQFSSTQKVLHAEKGTRLPLDYSLFKDDAILFPHTNSHEVTLSHSVTGKGIRMAYPDFCSIAFWTVWDKKAPFLCLEPWNGAAIFEDEDDIFSHKRDVISLPSGETAVYKLEIELLGY